MFPFINSTLADISIGLINYAKKILNAGRLKLIECWIKELVLNDFAFEIAFADDMIFMLTRHYR